MKQRPSIAVIILTYNESLHLARALDSIRTFATEIFVVDSFSTDATVEIARSRGAQVLTHPFQNYARQFEWAIQNSPATADWVMRLDADEVIERDLAEEIVHRLPELPSNVTGINLNRKTIFQGKFIRHGGRYPLTLLRIWRRGKAHIEDRWMDEHMYLTEGTAITLRGGFADHSLLSLTAFIDKHNRYASREALDVLMQRRKISGQLLDLASQSTSRQAKLKRFAKEHIYNRIPFELSSLSYFVLRYVLQFGFLDGRPGLIYHVLQGFWYRFLVGAKLRELEAAVQSSANEQEALCKIAQLTGQKLSSD